MKKILLVVAVVAIVATAALTVFATPASAGTPFGDFCRDFARTNEVGLEFVGDRVCKFSELPKPACKDEQGIIIGVPVDENTIALAGICTTP